MTETMVIMKTSILKIVFKCRKLVSKKLNVTLFIKRNSKDKCLCLYSVPSKYKDNSEEPHTAIISQGFAGGVIKFFHEKIVNFDVGGTWHLQNEASLHFS